MKTIKLIMALSILPIISDSYASEDEINKEQKRFDDYHETTILNRVKTQLIERYGQTEEERVSAISGAIIDIAEEGFVPQFKDLDSFNDKAVEQEKTFMDLSHMIKFELIQSMPLEILEHVLGKIEDLKKLHNNFKYDLILSSILDGYYGLLGVTDFSKADDKKLQDISNKISEILQDTTESIIEWQKQNGDRNKDKYISQIRMESTYIASRLPEALKESFKKTDFYKNNAEDIDNWSSKRFNKR